MELKEEICSIAAENKGRYGYRRVTAELRNRGFLYNHKLVMKLMKQLGVSSKVRMKKYHSYKGEVGKIAPNLLERDFYAEKPNQKWVTDVTEFSLFGEKLYLSPILDLCSEDLVCYTLSDRPTFGMVTSMLEKAFETIPNGTGLILHSDQGSVYSSKKYNELLPMYNILRSMSRAGTPTDNAAMEAINGWIKAELFADFHVTGEREVSAEVDEYIAFFNEQRPAYSLNYLTPQQYRERYGPTVNC